MLRDELKAALVVIGMTFTPLFVQADQPMYMNPRQEPLGYEPGEKIRDGQVPGAYHQSSMYTCTNPWEVFFTGNYLCWKWQQDSFQLGTLVKEGPDALAPFRGNATALFQDPNYASGFRTGVGINLNGMDNWSLYSEYTWYENTDHTQISGGSLHPVVLPISSFRSDQTLGSQSKIVGTIASEVELGFQALDFLAQRPFYFGKRVTVNVGVGLRAQWMSQNFNISGSDLSDETTGLEISSLSVESAESTWGLGPKLALDSNWLLGYGFKIKGNFSTSILYTSYNTSVDRSETVTDVGTLVNRVIGLHNYGTLRPVTESFLGFGWGAYFCSNNFHIDFSLGYDFNVYWVYNMLNADRTQSVGNMYLHGVNIGARFDF